MKETYLLSCRLLVRAHVVYDRGKGNESEFVGYLETYSPRGVRQAMSQPQQKNRWY